MKTLTVSIMFLLLAPAFAFAQTPPSCVTVNGTEICAQNPPAETPPAVDPPSVAAAYQFMRHGIFDCNLNGAYAMSVGSMAATGGVYVPVADATVELNTGILVYKECILREIIVRQREAATAAFGKRAAIGIQTGRDGRPQYVVNQAQERLTGAMD